MDFGFTNDKARLDAVHAYRNAAVLDGWTLEPTYPKHEAADRAATLKREGFVMMTLSRENTDKREKFHYEAKVHIWGPDGLAISPPDTYNFAEIQARIRQCHYCNAKGVDTRRVGFAGRCCTNCLPEVRKKVECPGWDN
jgi:hypothetical protein